ncbi:MAG: hypothetical protein LBV72_20105 [Tannerella sp.]|jgi:hypothetical protein|nr:hypothetical protein [Tannerella sp.]
MMDFITAPLVVGIIVLGTYKLFELFVRRKERVAIIEKIGDKLDLTRLGNNLNSMFGGGLNFKTSFSGLKIGCLLIGLGLGLLVGLMISTALVSDGYNMHDYRESELYGTAYGASVLLFGGIGLLVSFLVELKLKNKKKEE